MSDGMHPDQAAIATIVECVGVLADRGEFDALARMFADEFQLDYSSLNGVPTARKAPSELMAEWAGVLPGFDRTRHALSNIMTSISGETASARADVTASHWIGDLFWEVTGHYDYAFSKANGEWRITSMTFVLEAESGTRDVFALAMEAAGSRNRAGRKALIAERNKATVRTFFRALESGDISALVGLFADDGIQINPYTGGMFPDGARGKDELRKYWTPVPGNFEEMRFPIDELLATEGPNVIFVRYRGDIKLKDGAGFYRNNYYSTFRFNDAGEITEYVEIFDPLVAARSFGLLDRILS